jgi:ATP-dependent RNA circularization protein (DNA/RNA ligase family)
MTASPGAEPGFFRFPHTPHLAWLGRGDVRGDKVLTPGEAEEFLAEPLALEEKLDGANLGLSLDGRGELRVQQRGEYLQEPYGGQFARLRQWLAVQGPGLRQWLQGPEGRGLVLFGEWCAARHSLDYAALPDLFLLFDVADPATGRFWSRRRRLALAAELGLAAVPTLREGRFDLEGLQQLLVQQPSRYRPGPMEGVVLRRDDADWCLARSKLVRPEFTQAIAEHWRHQPLVWNGIDYSGSSGPG